MTQFSSTHWSQIRRGRCPQDSHYEEAWQYLLSRYRPLIIWFFERYAPNPDLLAEWTDAFIAAWVGGKLDGAKRAKGRFRGYLFASLNSFYTDQLRKLALRQTVGTELLDAVTDERIDDPADLHDREFARVVITRALERLRQFEDKRQQEGAAVRWYSLLQAYYVAPDSASERPGHQELAERHGLTAKAVERQLASARTQLRSWIEADLSQTVCSEDELSQELALLIRHSRGLFRADS
ncbi:sigma-70 family RNA polymerase sigma factor [Acidimicrobium ferrooxidans]|nr:sigma-70 family RNA polymerase sigma factor [Acidimicrobium ferrooxidans]